MILSLRLKKRQLRITGLDSSHHHLICSKTKISLPELSKHNDIFVRLVKIYFAEKIIAVWKSFFPNYLTYACVKDACSSFIYNFVEAIGFVAPTTRKG